MTFEQYLAAYALGWLLTTDLPDAAAQALAEGSESVDLAALAGSAGSESPSELQEMWLGGLRQAGKTLPSRVAAGRILRQHYAERVASGSLAPRAGAAMLVRLANELQDVLPTRRYVGDGLGLARLVGHYYSHDDVPRDDARAHEAIDAEIRAECSRLAKEETP